MKRRVYLELIDSSVPVALEFITTLGKGGSRQAGHLEPEAES